MATAIEARLIRMEILMRRLADENRALKSDIDALKRNQGMAQSGPFAGAGGGGAGGRGVIVTASSDGSFASPSDDGEVQLYRLNSSGDWVPRGEPVAIYNQFGGGSIEVNAGVLTLEISGRQFVAAAPCPS